MAPPKPRQRKRRVLDRQRAAENGDQKAAAAADDSNAAELVPAEHKEREEKKAALRKQLAADASTKVSGKKAKRLEKYIESKLRKDETRELLQKLADAKIDTTLFASTRNLGQAKETKKQALSRGLREERAGLELGKGDRQRLLYETRKEADEDEDGGEDEEMEDGEGTKGTGLFASKEPSKSDVGAGLKRPLELDESGQPVLKKRKKRGGVDSKATVAMAKRLSEEQADQDSADEKMDEEEYPEWSGFGSDDDDEQDDESKESGEDDSEEDGSSGEEDEEDDDEDEDEDDDDDDKEDDSDSDSQQDGAARSSAFKAWAQQQRNEALGYQTVESNTAIVDVPKPANFKPRPVEEEELPRELRPTTNTSRKAYSVTVARTPEIDASRIQLPIISEEQRLMEAIHDNDVVVICGATGSGKTTQVPQFLYESGYGAPGSETPGMIGVTQPRRVAAVSMSKRVAEELGDHGKRVGYRIRFEGTTDPNTAIKFMTDGVLVREVAQQFQLDQYSAIIVDEAHERSVNTDILIGMLSRIVKLRRELHAEDPKVKPLKLIIMSATLRVQDMTQNARLFPTPPPVLEVEGRQHPVSTHFCRRTRHDYVDEAYNKITRGHRKLPPGGMLVFLTGQNEIAQLKRRLEESVGGMKTADPKSVVRISASEAPIEVEDFDFGHAPRPDLDEGGGFDELDIDNAEDPNEFDIAEGDGQPAQPPPQRMHILPLYSLLPTREQLRVFAPPPPNSRLVILSTNVAETSLTIPGIRYVFDSGRSKERRYDPVTGVQSYEIGWVSRASANQRAGRAGRTGPGHCYRLYSSAVYENDFDEFADPELLRMPIEGVVLQLKAMNLANVVNFPFPTPPDRQSIVRAEKLLHNLQALSLEGRVTKLGQSMSIFPLAPRFARILLVGHLNGCLPYTISLVAALSASEVFIPESQAVGVLSSAEDGLPEDDDDDDDDDDTNANKKTWRTNAQVLADQRRLEDQKGFNSAHRKFSRFDEHSDAMKLLVAVGHYSYNANEKWCRAHFVRHKALQEVHLLRRQITELLAANIPAFKALAFQDQLQPPSAAQIASLKQMVAAGFIDNIAIRAKAAPTVPEVVAHARKPRRAIDVAYLPLTPLHVGNDENPCVYIHPSSILARFSPDECPDYVVYSHLQRSSGGTGKTRMHALTDVTAGQLASLAKGTPLVRYGKPVKEVRVEARERDVYVVPYLRAEESVGMGWPLPMRKVTQRKTAEGWVVVV